MTHIANPAALVQRAALLNDLGFQRQTRKLHQQPSRVLAEFLADVISNPTQDILGKLTRFSQINRSALEQTGGNRFPTAIFAVSTSIKSRVSIGVADRREILRTALNDDGGDAA